MESTPIVVTEAPKKDQSGLAIASLVLGILSLCGWFVPICGFPMTIVGGVLGFLGLKSTRRGLAIAGLVLCAIALILTIVNAVAGAALATMNPGFIQDLMEQIQSNIK
jgi:hypothetical protein